MARAGVYLRQARYDVQRTTLAPIFVVELTGIPDLLGA